MEVFIRLRLPKSLNAVLMNTNEVILGFITQSVIRH